MRQLVILATAILCSGAANAMTVVSSSNGPDTGPVGNQHVITDFETSAGLSGAYTLATGTSSGQYAAPYQDETQYLAVRGGEMATLALSPSLKSVSFYWGSIDAYNTVNFFNGSELVGSFTGNEIPKAPADGSQGDPTNNRRVSFNFGGTKVTSVQFASTQNAFELDTVAGAVPEPATWAMLVLGFGMVGASVRRRTKTAVAA